MRLSSRTVCVLLPLILSACAVRDTTPDSRPTSRIGEAVTAPLVDLNLLRTKIPEVLIEVQKSPYQKPADMDCMALSAEIQALDEALGPDLDAPIPDIDPTLIERGRSEAGDAAIDALKGAAVGWIPYRGWVRKLTGAERHSKEVSTAIAAGIVRRAYLKGIGQSHGCPAPAAPITTEKAK